MKHPPSKLLKTLQLYRMRKQFRDSSELLIFIDKDIIDYRYIDTHNTDITF